jgi:TRIAD3 protein (E3 ubiquitin-protein ligase RNF216)
MSKCIAITKKGTPCLNNSKSIHHGIGDNQPPPLPSLFCGIHLKNKPDLVRIAGTDKIVPYVNEKQYLADLQIANQQSQKNPPITPSLKIHPALNKINQPEKTPELENLDVITINNTDYYIDRTNSNVYTIDSNEDIGEFLGVYNHQTDSITSARDIPQHTIVNTKLKCIVCNDEYHSCDGINLFACDASGASATNAFNHLVCRECLKGHIGSQISDGIASLECMFNKHDHCHGTYTEEHIKQALETSACADTGAASAVMQTINFSKWQEIMITSEIIKFAGICDNYVICPLCCKWGCIFEIPIGAEKHPFYITCGNCSKQWCTLCKRGVHGTRSCYELALTEKELASANVISGIIDKMIQDIATRALTHCCGICGCSYVKEEGCNLMTCAKCNGMSCFICGMKLYYKGDNKYWHFTGHDKADRDANCPLWNNYAGDGLEKQGNTKFNIANIEKEFDKFISSNARNKQIAKIICNRIITNYEDDKAFANIIKKIRKTISAF